MKRLLHGPPSPPRSRRAVVTACTALLTLGGVTLAQEVCYPADDAAGEQYEPDDLRRSMSDAELRELGPGPLRAHMAPEPPKLWEFVRDKKAAIALGKALFWDQRVGSQGMACASCHFQAGADPRVKNQLSPGLLADDPTFQPTGGGGAGGPNYTLRKADFPFHRKVDPTKNDSASGNTLFDTNDVASSQGVALARFLGATYDPATGEHTAIEDDTDVDEVFKVAAQKVRRVEGRNTPTVITRSSTTATSGTVGRTSTSTGSTRSGIGRTRPTPTRGSTPPATTAAACRRSRSRCRSPAWPRRPWAPR